MELQCGRPIGAPLPPKIQAQQQVEVVKVIDDDDVVVNVAAALGDANGCSQYCSNGDLGLANDRMRSARSL